MANDQQYKALMFLFHQPEQAAEQTVELVAIWDAMTLMWFAVNEMSNIFGWQ